MNNINMNIRVKREILNQNIHKCNYGEFRKFPKYKAIKSVYDNEFTTIEPNSLPEVSIFKADCLTIGVCYMKKKYNPVILNLIDSEYDGANRDTFNGFRDEALYLRSDLYATMYKRELFPLKNNELIYSQGVLIIRDENFNIVDDVNIISVITSTAIKRPKLNDDLFNLDDYKMTFEKIGNIFQAAYITGHDTLILNSFGCNEHDENSISDTIEIYNYYIIKYGHMFKNILFCTPPNGQYGIDIIKQFTEKIYKFDDIINV